MSRVFRLAFVLLPLALAAVGVAAQEHAPRPGGGHGPRSGSPEQRDMRQREMPARAPRPEQAPSQAAPKPPTARAEARPSSRSISEAVRRVQRSTRGQILGAEQVPFEGRSITRIKYMDERGRVRYMDDPGASERRPPRRADNDEP